MRAPEDFLGGSEDEFLRLTPSPTRTELVGALRLDLVGPAAGDTYQAEVLPLGASGKPAQTVVPESAGLRLYTSVRRVISEVGGGDGLPRARSASMAIADKAA